MDGSRLYYFKYLWPLTDSIFLYMYIYVYPEFCYSGSSTHNGTFSTRRSGKLYVNWSLKSRIFRFRRGYRVSQAQLYVRLRFPNVIMPAILPYDNVAVLAQRFRSLYITDSIELCFVIMKLKLRPL